MRSSTFMNVVDAKSGHSRFRVPGSGRWGAGFDRFPVPGSAGWCLLIGHLAKFLDSFFDSWKKRFRLDRAACPDGVVSCWS